MFRLACLLILILLTYNLVDAVDAPSTTIGPDGEEPTGSADGGSKRTLFNIIQGCVSTTIICTWAAIHPNIPPREGPVKGLLRRLELMFWAIVAPEILPSWALNQWLAARTIRNLYNKKAYGELSVTSSQSDELRSPIPMNRETKSARIWQAFCGTLKRWFSFSEIKEPASYKWTTRHGHFLIMGGFHLVEPVEKSSTTAEKTPETQQVANVHRQSTSPEVTQIDPENVPGPGKKVEFEKGSVTILTLEMLRELLNDSNFSIQITEEEIGDRSKGDALSKLVLILQSSWFISQCIARYSQGLSLTQLELTTLALASLNGITFLLWWSKPVAVETPMRVLMPRRLTDAERTSEGRRNSARSNFRSRDPNKIEENIAPSSRLNPRYRKILWIVVIIILAPILLVATFGLALVRTISDVMWTSSSFPVDATHVPTFYVPKHDYPAYWHILLLLVCATIFGGIHCAGWNLPFPTYAEQKLWHIASVTVTVFPIAVIPSAVIIPIVILIAVLVYFIIAVLIVALVGVIAVLIVGVIGVIGFVVAYIAITLFRLLLRLLFLIARLIVRSHIIDLLDLMEDNLKPIIPTWLAFANTKPTTPDTEPTTPDTQPTPDTEPIPDTEPTTPHIGLTQKVVSLFYEMSGPDRIVLIQGFMMYFMVAYGVARLVLLGLAVALLRHQPPSVFIPVDWTAFFPHIF